MGKQFNLIFSILFVLVLVVTSACRNTDDLAYYYNNNGTGAGNDNNCCCGCCNNNNADIAATYCEPEAPELVACEDGTINITGYSNLVFATEGGSCESGQYISAAGGVMTFDGSGRLLNSSGETLIWIAQGDSVASPVIIPRYSLESMVVLPDGTIIGYTNNVPITLGKLITVLYTTLGSCSPVYNTNASIGRSILWCGKRVCSKKVAGVVSPVKTLASIKVEIPVNTYLTVSQKDFDISSAPNIYVTGIKRLAIRTDGILIEKETCMPVLSEGAQQISVPTSGISKLGISGKLFKVNDETLATLSVTTPERLHTVLVCSSCGLSSGFRLPAKGLSSVMINIDESLNTIGVEQNVCIQSDFELF